MHDSFFPFLFLFLLIAGGILRQYMSVYLCYRIFLVVKPHVIKKRNSNSENKSNATTIKY
jgi:hypothetical protein